MVEESSEASHCCFCCSMCIVILDTHLAFIPNISPLKCRLPYPMKGLSWRPQKLPTLIPTPSSFAFTMPTLSIPTPKTFNHALDPNSLAVLPSDQPQKKGNLSIQIKIPTKFRGPAMEVLQAVISGQSVFFTGAAGTGKSNVLKHAVKILRQKYGDDHVFVTASTGVAASSINGTTLQAFAGVGFGIGHVDALVAKVRRNKQVESRWVEAKALVIDEISMIEGELFDKLNYIAKKIRRDETQEFGGIQMVVTGDFFQLPPVNPQNPSKIYTFQADCWDNCFDIQIELKRILRQTDYNFMGMLNQIRKGVCSQKTIDLLNACRVPSSNRAATRLSSVLPAAIPSIDGGDIAFTILCPHKADAEMENGRKLKALGKEIVTFYAEDSGVEEQLQRGLAVKELSLCVGAQVMLNFNSNTEKGLGNGRKGVVIGFEKTLERSDISPSGVWPIVKFVNCQTEVVRPKSFYFWGFGKYGSVVVTAKRVQVPLVLAWALSVHKCQGMTLDRIETDLTRASEYGMVYVALSRLTRLQGLRLVGFHPSNVRAHPKVLEFYEDLKRRKMETKGENRGTGSGEE